MVTREELYEAVWAEPLIKLAERFQVSGSYLARVCDSLRVPRPDRGYWAKKAVGAAPPKPPLPAIEQSEPMQWSPGNGVLIRRSSPRGEAAQAPKRERKKTHELLHGATAHFAHGRTIKEGEYLKPYKRHLVDIVTSQACLVRALSFANAFFLALEDRGHPVRIFAGQDGALHRPPVDPLDPPSNRTRHNPHHNLWSPGRLTVVHIGGKIIGLSIVEVAETTVMRYVGNGAYVPDADYLSTQTRSKHHRDSTWTTTMERPSGRLRLIAYAPYYRVEMAKQWQETKGPPLTDCVPEIIVEIEAMAVKMADLVAQAERQLEKERRQYEAERRRYAIQENERKLTESVKESRSQLDSIIRLWAETQARSDFLAGLERSISLLPEPERMSIQQRVVLARELLGPIDPMAHFAEWRTPKERYVPKHFEEEE